LWVLLAVVAAVGVGYLVGSSDTATVAGVVSNADDASVLQGEKEALTSVDSSTTRSWQASTDRLSGLAAQGSRVAASGFDGAGAADAANALQQDGQVQAAGFDGAAAADAANALVASPVGDVGERDRERDASDRLVSLGLVPDAAFDRDDEVLDRLVAHGLVPGGGA